MLRGWVIAFGVVALLGGLLALETSAFPPAAILGIWGVLVVLGTVFERVTYKSIQPNRPGPDWQRTTERFIDDQTGRPVTVYVDPKTGERAYINE